MPAQEQNATPIFDRNVRTRTLVLVSAVLFVTTIVAQPAQAQTFTVLHTFTGGVDGSAPGGTGLTIDRGGNLYGGTDSGGLWGCYDGSCGVLYKLSHKSGGWLFNTLYEFHGGDGSAPDAPLAFGPDGALYGTTYYGGGDDIGVLYKLQPPPFICKADQCMWIQTIVHSFTGANDGSQPAFGALSFDSAGDIYGTAAFGGANRYGTVFEVSPYHGEWLFETLWTFSGQPDGAYPWSGVIFDAAGNLYGTTTAEGYYYGGTAYELTPSAQGWNLTILHQFVPSTDGNQAFGNLVFDSSGDLLGTNRFGGPGDAGGVFKLTPYNNSWEFGVLYSFTGVFGPQASVAMDPSGNLYGTSVGGGQYGNGFVFKMIPSGGEYLYSVLHDFTGGYDGAYPYGQIVLDANGNLYGIAQEGGQRNGNCSYGCGVVWEITP